MVREQVATRNCTELGVFAAMCFGASQLNYTFDPNCHLIKNFIVFSVVFIFGIFAYFLYSIFVIIETIGVFCNFGGSQVHFWQTFGYDFWPNRFQFPVCAAKSFKVVEMEIVDYLNRVSMKLCAIMFSDGVFIFSFSANFRPVKGKQ